MVHGWSQDCALRERCGKERGRRESGCVRQERSGWREMGKREREGERVVV
jgi:hypothetical protein